MLLHQGWPSSRLDRPGPAGRRSCAMPWSWPSPTSPTELFPPSPRSPVTCPSPRSRIDATISVPGSKKPDPARPHRRRPCLGESRLHGPLASEDTRYTIAALAAMGLQVDAVIGTAGGWRAPAAIELPARTSSRQQRHGHPFLTSLATLGHGGTRASPAANAWPSGPSCTPCSRPCAAEAEIVNEAGSGCPPPDHCLPWARRSDRAPERTVEPVPLLPASCGPLCSSAGRTGGLGRHPIQPYVRMTLAVAAFGIQVEARGRYQRLPHSPGAVAGRAATPSRATPAAPATSGPRPP